jgi:hypothetical protein
MKTTTKVKLAHLTTWTMVMTISFIALFFIGFIVSSTFDLNVFTNKTSNFIGSFIAFSAVIVLCSAILNVSLNISIIADSKTQEVKETNNSFITKKFLSYTLGLIIIIIAFLFFGDYRTRLNEKNKIMMEANDLIVRYKSSIDQISIGLSDTSKISKVPDILDFLGNQKQGLTSVVIITSGKFNGQLTFLVINQFIDSVNLKKPFYNNSFYKCESQDCDYLNSFFNHKTQENLFWTEGNEYKFYVPIEYKDKKYILLFSNYEREGKYGS